ncbi:GIP [Symbiodinium pilosum]|uniref:GIP protein n=1 Tax=Symbiodinium pilosum TaxID=2952 RepID=A0A812U9J7_SYMPI|nr:GIP [Symbiodinium pilosum]
MADPTTKRLKEETGEYRRLQEQDVSVRTGSHLLLRMHLQCCCPVGVRLAHVYHDVVEATVLPKARTDALSAFASAPSPYSDKMQVSPLERPALPQGLRVRRPDQASEDGACLRPVKNDMVLTAEEEATGLLEVSNNVDAGSSDPDDGNGLCGLSQYASDESCEESDSEEGDDDPI